MIIICILILLNHLSIPGFSTMQGHRGFRLKPLNAMLSLLFISSNFAAPSAHAVAQNASGDTIQINATNNVAPDDQTSDLYNYVAKDATAPTKLAIPLMQTTQSVSVITQAQINAQGAKNVSQALRYNAGVLSEVGGADYRFDTVYIRGFQADEYLDGLRLPTVTYWARPNFDAYMLDRIEVLKGPSSVLYGQSNPGGVVNLVSKRPTADPIHEVYVTLGNHNDREAGIDLSGALDNDEHWLGRLTASGSKSDTQVDYTQYEHYDIAPSLTWKPNDNTSLTFLSQFRRDPDAGFFNQLPVVGTLVSSPNGKIPTGFYGGQPGLDSYTRKQASIGYQFEHHFDDVWTVRQNLRYLASSSDYTMTYPFGNVANSSYVDRYTFLDHESLKAFDVDTQAQAKFDTGPVNHTLLFGVDYVHDDLRENSGSGVASPIDYLNPDYSAPVARPDYTAHQRLFMTQTGFYAQDQMKWQKWIFNVAGRYDQAQTRTTTYETGSRRELNNYATTGRTGLMYQFDSGFAPYVSYATSFEPLVGTTFAGNAFKPTKGKQSEIGLKYQPKSIDALFTASLFNLTQTNVATADPDHVNYTLQTGEVRSKGLELDGKVNITPDWLVSANYAYTSPVVTSSNDGNEGKVAVSIPRHTGTLWTQYSLHGLLEGLTVGGGARYVGTAYANSENTLKVPAATVYDAMARYRWKAWQIAFNVQNLTDKVYVNTCQDNGCHYGLRRQYLTTLSYQW